MVTWEVRVNFTEARSALLQILIIPNTLEPPHRRPDPSTAGATETFLLAYVLSPAQAKQLPL